MPLEEGGWRELLFRSIYVTGELFRANSGGVVYLFNMVQVEKEVVDST